MKKYIINLIESDIKEMQTIAMKVEHYGNQHREANRIPLADKFSREVKRINKKIKTAEKYLAAIKSNESL